MSSRPPRPAGRQRRALSAARAGGRIDQGGDPALAPILVDALAAPARDPDAVHRLTHPFHTYPARMHPTTAAILLGALDPRRGRGVVLDPFCGSGTTLVEARARGMAAIGGDLNPLAVAICRAKTWTAPPARRRELAAIGREISARALAEGKAARRSGHRAAPLRRVGGDPAARDRALTEWFAPHVRREVEQLAGEIDAIAADDHEIADILRVVLSSILYKVSRRRSDTDAERVERNVARGAAARLFGARVGLLHRGLDELARSPGAMPRVFCADARRLDREVASASVDLVVSSPPYAGTYDYGDLHGLRMTFLGLDPGAVSRREIGARKRFAGGEDPRRRALAVHLADLATALGQLARALRPGGRAALVVGDSLAGRGAVLADRVLREALAQARAPLAAVAWASQERPLLGGAERRAFAAIAAPKREHVILLERA